MTEIRKIHWLARGGVALVFIYHGLVPKILWLSQTEAALTESHNLGLPATILSPLAGLAEIALGLLVLLLPRSLLPVYFSALMLTLLLIDVAVMMPQLLIEAFNPVTINITTIMLCYIVVLTQNLGKPAEGQ